MSGSSESVRWNVCVHRLDLGLYSHPKKFWWNLVRTHVNSTGKKKSLQPEKKKFSSEEDRTHDRYIKQDSEPNTQPMSYSGPP